jgi:DNA-binding Lrp family transcriptional regulator
MTRAWRYSTSDGTLRASISFIEEEIGLSHASISRSFKTLKELGLIKIVETDFKKGNLWEVSQIAYGGGTEKYHSQNEPPQNEVAQNKTEANSKRGTSSLKLSEKVPQSEGEYKKYLININKNLKSEKLEKIVFLENKQQENSDLEKNNALELFEAELTDVAQEEIISEFKIREYPHEFYPPPKVIKSLVALNWAKTRNPQSYQIAI